MINIHLVDRFTSKVEHNRTSTNAKFISSDLALVVLTGLGGGGGSTSDSAPDSELLSFSPFFLLLFFLLLCFLCFLFFLCGGSIPSLALISSFSGASSSPAQDTHAIFDMFHNPSGASVCSFDNCKQLELPIYRLPEGRSTAQSIVPGVY